MVVAPQREANMLHYHDLISSNAVGIIRDVTHDYVVGFSGRHHVAKG